MKLLFFFVLALTTSAFAQPSDYWQQHVSYQIEASLLDSIHSLDGKLQVVYTNNSPDTLREIYFHLYNNAFRPGSMMHKRAQELNDQGLLQRFERYKSPADWGRYTITSVYRAAHEIGISDSGIHPYDIIDKNTNSIPNNYSMINPAEFDVSKLGKLDFVINGTIMKVKLDMPLPPKGGKVAISFSFLEQIPRQTRRNGWMNSDSIAYSMAQCYPKVCAYDREGWHNQEYISREFYGVWGEFDVKLTVPAKYCVGATGQVQNPDEVKWGYEKIAKGEKKGVVYPKDYPRSGDITWHFKASNVHDFAWVAHNYIHEWDTWSDTVTVHCLYKTNEEKEWKQAMKHTLAMLEHHSKAVGWYQYRNFYNTHSGDGGMEYPQLIMDMSPNAGLIMHEGAHQWFYGMLGTNETRYAFLDEGFTEFLEMVGMESYYGRHNERSPHRDTSWLTKMFIPEYDTRRNYYSPYLNLATDGYEEPLNIPHDWAREGVNAGQVYFKTLNGLAQLEYVLGDSVFWAGMKEYFRRWHFKSPNLNDFKRTMEDVSSTKLDWYFDQWFHTTRTIDYSACGVSSEEQPDGTYKTTVELYNNDLSVMPIDLTLKYDDGSTGIATIPLALNQGSGYQKPESGRIYFPSWDWVSKGYEGTVTTPKKVKSFEVDSSYRLMDLNRWRNTSSKFIPPLEFGFLEQLNNYQPLSGPYAVLRPIVWYEETSKLNLGAGVLLGQTRSFTADIKVIGKTAPERLGVSLSTGEVVKQDPLFDDYFDFQIKATLPTKMLGNLTNWNLLMREMYGIYNFTLGLDHIIRPDYRYLGPTQTVSASFELSKRSGEDDNFNYIYPIYHEGWGDPWTFIVAGKYSFASSSGNTRFSLAGEHGNTFASESNGGLFGLENNYEFFGGWDFKFGQRLNLSDDFGFAFRVNAAGQFGNVPTQKLYQRGRANNAQEDKNEFGRAVTSISRHFSYEANFYSEGGAGVRGYSSGSAYGGVGFSTEMNLPNPLRKLGWLPASVSPFVFFDAGWVGNEVDLAIIKKELSTDAGIGFKIDLLSWLPWQLQGVAGQYASVPTIGLHFPIYLNHPDDGKENFAFRYVISLGTTF